MIGRSLKQTYKALISNKQQANIVFATQGLNEGIQQADPILNDLIKQEQLRQKNTINLIPSENYTSSAAKEAVGSIMNSKYSEGLPLNRYYGGNQFIDKMEILCQNRSLELFGLDSKDWGINVQPHSLSPANFHVLTGLLQNHDRVMSLSVEHGGHLSHGQNVKREKLSAGSYFFEVLNYSINEKTGLIDYEKLEEQAKYFLPKVIFGGADLYTRSVDYERIKKICDSIGATFVVDLGQVAGLVSTKILPSPFQYADIVTSPTHKSLRGPRGALVFYRQGVKGLDKKGNEIKYDFKNKIENAIFPGSQGGPHNHTIAGIAVALKEAQQPYFKEYQQQVVKNASTLCDFFGKKDYKLLTNGSDNHLVLVNLQQKGVNSQQLLTVLEKLHIDTFRSSLPNGKSTFLSSYLALGAHPMTTRGCTQNDFITIAQFIDTTAGLVKELSTKAVPSTPQEINQWAESTIQSNSTLQKIQSEALAFAQQFGVPGI